MEEIEIRLSEFLRKNEAFNNFSYVVIQNSIENESYEVYIVYGSKNDVALVDLEMEFVYVIKDNILPEFVVGKYFDSNGSIDEFLKTV